MNLIGIFTLLASATASQANALTPNFLRGASRHLQSTCTIDTSLDVECPDTTDGVQQCRTFFAGQTIDAGTVCLSQTGSDVTVTVLTTGGWELTEVHAHWGTDKEDFPQTRKGNPKIGNFMEQSGDITGDQSYSFVINLYDNDLCCTAEGAPDFLMAVHAAVRKSDGSGQEETAWADGERFVDKGSWSTLFDICLKCSEGGSDGGGTQETCETAFAYAADTPADPAGECFLGIDADEDGTIDGFQRWGWTIGPFGSGDYTFPIYAGAGQCVLSKGTHVGNLGVNYDGSTATVTYTSIAPYTWDEVHVYVGSEVLPRQNGLFDGAFTVAPGQYPNILEDLDSSTSPQTVEVPGIAVSGNVYVVAHAVACGF